MARSYTLEEMRKANNKAGGKFFHSSHLKHMREWGGTHTVENNVVTVTFPESDEYPKGNSYRYRFFPDTGEMKPLTD